MLLPLQPPGTRLVLGYRRKHRSVYVSPHWRHGRQKHKRNPAARVLRLMAELAVHEQQFFLLCNVQAKNLQSDQHEALELFVQLCDQNTRLCEALSRDLFRTSEEIKNYNFKWNRPMKMATDEPSSPPSFLSENANDI